MGLSSGFKAPSLSAVAGSDALLQNEFTPRENASEGPLAKGLYQGPG